MIFIDANIFLEVALDDARSDECEELFLKIKNENIRATTSDFIIYTCLLQIENKIKSAKDMENFVVFVDNLKSLDIMPPRYHTLYNAFDITKKHKLDFDDALIVAMMTSSDIKDLVSFDRHFDRVDEIKRVEQRHVIASQSEKKA